MPDTIVKEREAVHHHHSHRHPKVRPIDAAKTFKVTVVAKPGTGINPIDFSLDSNLKQGGHLVFNKSDDGMKKADYYLIEFDLDDRTSLGLVFDPNPMDAFWVSMGDNVAPPPCPATAAYSEQIYAIIDDPNGRSLTIRNNDDDHQYFSFSLGFIDEHGTAYRYDPTGQNQNSGTSRE